MWSFPSWDRSNLMSQRVLSGIFPNADGQVCKSQLYSQGQREMASLSPSVGLLSWGVFAPELLARLAEAGCESLKASWSGKVFPTMMHMKGKRAGKQHWAGHTQTETQIWQSLSHPVGASRTKEFPSEESYVEEKWLGPSRSSSITGGCVGRVWLQLNCCVDPKHVGAEGCQLLAFLATDNKLFLERSEPQTSKVAAKTYLIRYVICITFNTWVYH